MPKTQLSELQAAVMQVLWHRGEATAAEVRADLEADRNLALTTVSTILSRLEKQGAATHRSIGRQYVYRPLVREQDVKRSMVGSLVDRLFSGDAAALVSHLVSEHDIDPDELDRLKETLETRQEEEDQ